jgi:hypothetical protein
MVFVVEMGIDFDSASALGFIANFILKYFRLLVHLEMENHLFSVFPYFKRLNQY